MLSGTPPHGRSRSDDYPVNMYLAEVDLSRIDTRPVRLNVSLPALCAGAGAWPQGD